MITCRVCGGQATMECGWVVHASNLEPIPQVAAFCRPCAKEKNSWLAQRGLICGELGELTPLYAKKTGGP